MLVVRDFTNRELIQSMKNQKSIRKSERLFDTEPIQYTSGIGIVIKEKEENMICFLPCP